MRSQKEGAPSTFAQSTGDTRGKYEQTPLPDAWVYLWNFFGSGSGVLRARALKNPGQPGADASGLPVKGSKYGIFMQGRLTWRLSVLNDIFSALASDDVRYENPSSLASPSVNPEDAILSRYRGSTSSVTHAPAFAILDAPKDLPVSRTASARSFSPPSAVENHVRPP